jgi:hypothetical protein
LQDDTLTIAGRKIPCETWTVQDAMGVSKDWIARDASDLPRARIKLEKEGEEMERESVAAWEKMRAADQEVSCMVIENRSEGAGSSIEMKTWWSIEVPGHLVKSASTSVFNKSATQVQADLVVGFERRR